MSENSHDQVRAESERDRAAPLGVTEAQGAEMARLSQLLQQRLAESQALQQRLEESERDRVAQRALLQQNVEIIQQYAGIIHQQAEALTRLQTDRERIRQTLLTVSHTRAYKLLRALGRWETVASDLSIICIASCRTACRADQRCGTSAITSAHSYCRRPHTPASWE